MSRKDAPHAKPNLNRNLISGITCLKPIQRWSIPSNCLAITVLRSAVFLVGIMAFSHAFASAGMDILDTRFVRYHHTLHSLASQCVVHPTVHQRQQPCGCKALACCWQGFVLLHRKLGNLPMLLAGCVWSCLLARAAASNWQIPAIFFSGITLGLWSRYRFGAPSATTSVPIASSATPADEFAAPSASSAGDRLPRRGRPR